MNSSAPIRLLIHGASGRMGRALLRLAGEDPRFVLCAAVSGRRVEPDLDAPLIIAADQLEGAPSFDCALDFSLGAGFEGILNLCVERGAGLVSGTTGLSDDQQRAMHTAGARIPILWAANFSIGVVVLTELARRAAAALPGWDCNIIESHHTRKQDAPSGTALALGRAIEQDGSHAPAFTSIRAGDIVGEHCVQFTGLGERLELIHRATDRDIFARGSLEAAARIAGRAPGMYRLEDLLLS
ncbi:MAG: dihydrodipicolinate reductase C-terminal domain-containing protein [Lysobacteraceae bacterium]